MLVSACPETPVHPPLELTGVGVIVDDRPILSDVTWTVERGQQWAVVGPNGGGKSTLLRVASFQLHPTRGAVRVLGQELGKTDIRALRSRIGLSSAALVDKLRGALSAEEIVRCGRFGALEPWWHQYEPSDTERAEGLLARVGLDGYGARRFDTLSSGERQRVLLARTLMAGPDLILLDEPTAGLDFLGREDLLRVLHRLAEDPTSPPTVIVTHRLEDLPETATHLLAIADGKPVAQGPLSETLSSGLMTRLFGLPVEVTRLGRRWAARTL